MHGMKDGKENAAVKQKRPQAVNVGGVQCQFENHTNFANVFAPAKSKEITAHLNTQKGAVGVLKSQVDTLELYGRQLQVNLDDERATYAREKSVYQQTLKATKKELVECQGLKGFVEAQVKELEKQLEEERAQNAVIQAALEEERAKSASAEQELAALKETHSAEVAQLTEEAEASNAALLNQQKADFENIIEDLQRKIENLEKTAADQSQPVQVGEGSGAVHLVPEAVQPATEEEAAAPTGRVAKKGPVRTAAAERQAALAKKAEDAKKKQEEEEEEKKKAQAEKKATKGKGPRKDGTDKTDKGR